jgi:hypothetical protein
MSKRLKQVGVTAVTVVALAAAGVTAAQQAKPAAAAANVRVTVKYTGKGTVDATHRIWVWLFDNPAIGPGAIPIAELSLDKNGGTAAFPNVSAQQVYVAVAYDEKGGFAGQAPPPPGSPIALYGVKAAEDPPLPITPGPKAAVTIALSDAQRMQ